MRQKSTIYQSNLLNLKFDLNFFQSSINTNLAYTHFWSASAWHSYQGHVCMPRHLYLRGLPPKSLLTAVILSLLLAVCGSPFEECWRGQGFVYLPRMSLDSRAAPTIKMPCATHGYGGMTNKSCQSIPNCQILCVC